MTYEEYIYAIQELNEATVAYDKGEPIMTDKEWDHLYFEVSEYEYWHDYDISPDSPTQKVHFEVVSELKKVKHNHPMLSLAKTKDVNEVEAFIGDHDYIMMEKLDGLTCSLRYNNGKLVSAETRGNGIEGEDITHNAMVIPSIPKRIPYINELIVDGEIVCKYKDFEPWADTYKNPRNFAAGSIRLLDSAECAKRNLTFIAWDLIDDFYETLMSKLYILEEKFHFEVVDYTGTGISCGGKHYTIAENIEIMKNEDREYPIDGIVFKYNNCKEYNAAGRTDHHFKGGLAYKFYDETYDTKLRFIDWTMGRTGVLTPVVVFDPVDADGSVIERASLHNYSVMLETLGQPYKGQPLKVFKANMIIPQIAEAEKSNLSVSLFQCKNCPICNAPTELVESKEGVINLICTNPTCEGKLINRLDHFCGKKGMDIKGLSKKTLEKLIDLGWLTCLSDIIDLQDHATEWKQLPGFGEKSVNNIINAIDDTFANTHLASFISALGIPLIGTRVSVQICEKVNSWEEFRNLIDTNFDFSIWDGFGYEMNKSLHEFDYSEADIIIDNLTIKVEEPQDKSVKLDGKIFVITGKLLHFKNRQQLVDKIEAAGGKVTSSISSKTNYLINNDIQSTSAKNKKALELNIPIITEEEIMEMIEDE